MKTALTIAGSDCSGGAGIQADIKTMISNGVYSMSVITALTAQNTLGIIDIFTVPSSFLEKQLHSIFTDIYPDSIKIGMIPSKEHAKIIYYFLKKYNAKNIVIDPVFSSSSGTKFNSDETIKAVSDYLFPISDLITPNIPESEKLSNLKIKSSEDMITTSKYIYETFNCPVLCKGGHSLNKYSNDLLYNKSGPKWFLEKRINTQNTHGTGCTLSSAIASNLAKGYPLELSIEKAKKYLSIILSSNLNLGKGSGPLDHGFSID